MADANLHYNAANDFAERAQLAAANGNDSAFDRYIDLAVLQARLGHLSLAINRRSDYIRHGVTRTRNGGSDRQREDRGAEE